MTTKIHWHELMFQTLKTRYRDISADEVRAIHQKFFGDWEFGRELWEKKRGTEIEIVLPPFMGNCGPMYHVAGREGFYACSHIAVIGD